MATGVGMSFDLDAALRNAEKLDKKLSDMVENASKLEQTMTNAFRAGGATEILSRLQQRLAEVGKTKVDVHFETKKAEEMYSIMDRIVGAVTIMAEQKLKLFDTQNLYATESGVLEVDAALKAVQHRMSEIKVNWADTFLDTTPDNFVAPRDRMGNVYAKDSKEYNNALDAHKHFERLKLESEMKALIEKEAILKKELQWSSMTEDQKAQYVQKRLNEVLKAEQKHTTEVQREYSKLSAEIIRIYDQIQRTEKSVAKGEKTGVDVSKEKGQLTTLENQLREKLARQQQIEQESGNLILQQIEDFWVKVQERDRKGLEDRIKAQQEAKKREEEERQRYIRTPEGAIRMSESAKSINDEREAIKLLIAARDNLSKSTANYQQIIDDLNNRIQKHRISVEQLTTAEKNEQTLQPTIRNEYARLLKELDQLADAKKRLYMTDAYKSNDADANRALNDIMAREQDVQNKIAEIRKNAQGLLDETERKHAADRANNEIAEIERVERKRQEYAKLYTGLSPMQAHSLVTAGQGTQAIANEERAIQRLVEQKYALDKQDQNYVQTINRLDDEIAEHKRNIQSLTEAERERIEQQKKQNQTFAGAIAFSDSAKTLQEERQAVKNLEAAREQLNTKTSEGKKQLEELNTRIKQHNKNIQEATAGAKDLQEKHRGLMNTSGQLARALAAVFSVSAIKGYVNKLMQIRGEFELQQRSLQVLLQNKDEANALWDKTVSLAVKSPYTTKQLVTATKQLAAYRVESEKLYETNKMLADVSIGLGVDMNRLILAFGQVKAANFLRGTELRQFSEAGVNMLDELAKRFTALEGRAVSVGEVFERVSKRMVSFADVEAVFKTITSEGGTFYQMQEKQSETLKGMMLNLKDSYELMLNDIGKSNEGMLKGFVSMMKTLVDNWQILSEVLKGIGAALVLYKLSVASTNSNLIAMALQMGVVNKIGTKQLTILNLLTLGFKKLTKGVKDAGSAMKAFMASNAITLTITAIIYALYKLYNAFSKHQEQLDEITEKYEDIENKISNVSVKFSYSKSEENLKTQYQKLADIAKNDLNLEIEVDLRGLSEADIKTKFANLRNEIANTIAFAREFEQSVVNSDVWWKPFDNIEKAFKRFGESATNLSDKIRNNSKTVQDFLQQTGIENQLLKDLLEEPSSEETELDYIRRVSAAYRLYEKTYHKVAQSIAKQKGFDYPIKQLSAIGEAIGKYEHDLKNAEKEFDEFAKTVNIPSNYNKEQRTLLIKAAIDKKGYTSFVRDLWYRLSNEKFDTEIQIQKPKPQSLDAWAKRVSKEVDKLNAQIKAKNKDIKDIDLFPLPEVGQTKEQYLALAKDVIDIAEATYTKNQQIVEDEEVARTNLLKDYAKAYKDILNIETKNKTNKKEQEAIRLMNERIRLIKEMHKEFLKLRENYDYATAKQKVMTSYAESFKDTFKGWNINLVGSVIDAESLARFKETGEISEVVAMKIAELEKSGTHIRNFNEALVDFIKKNEAFKEEAYSIGDGKWTLGYGETKGVKQGDTITKEEADAKLRERLTKDFASELNNILNLNKDLIFTQEQYNSLLDLTYQGGSSAISRLIDMARNVDAGVVHIERLREKIKGVFGEESAARFGEDFVNSLKDSENIYQRIALLLQTMNLTVNKGEISKELYKGMQARSDLRAQMFATGKDVSDILQNITKDFSALDITTKIGVVEFLKSLTPLAKEEGEKVAIELQRAIDGFEAEIGLDVQIQENQRFSREIENLFGNYEMSLELEKLNIPKDLASQLFGVEAIDLTSLRKQLLDRVGLGDMAGKTNADILDSDAYKKLNEHQRKELADHLQKVSQMEQKEQEERLKKYIAFSRKAMSERAKIKLEELQTIAEIEKTFAIKNGDSEEVKATKKQEKARALAQARKDAADALQKLDWEDFKSSDTFNSIFDDLENASDEVLKKVINRLKDFKAQWKDMPFEQMRQVVDLLQKAEEALKESDNPFTEAKRLKKAIKEDGISGEEAQLDVYNAEQLRAIHKEALANYELFEKVQNGQVAATQLSTEQLNEYVKWQKLSVGMQTNLVNVKKGEIAVQDEIIRKGNTQITNIKKLRNVYKEQSDSISEINKLTQDLYGSFMDLAENGASLFGKELDDTTKIFADMGASMADTVMQTVALWLNLKSVETGAYAAGTALNTAMGVIGWIVMGVQLLSQAFKAIVDAHDNGLQKQIDAEAKSVERLQKVYEDLYETVENTYNIAELNSAAQTAQNNLLAQINATERMIAAEEAKKKTDEEAIEGYKDEIDELKEKYKELEETRLQELGAFATDENKKSGAEAFLDAWLEAYKQTGDGLSGLNEQFDEFFEDMIKKQLLQRGAQKYLSQFYNEFDKAIADWGAGNIEGDDAINLIEQAKNRYMPELNDVLKRLAEALGIAGDLAGKDAELSGLQAGIQGITEDQADVLASYWNSVRGYTADTNAKVAELVTKLFSDDTTANPMLSQLLTIAEQTRAIRDMFESVIGRGGNNKHGGAYLKVDIG